jgi:hypothetical protein
LAVIDSLAQQIAILSSYRYTTLVISTVVSTYCLSLLFMSWLLSTADNPNKSK